MLVIEQYTITTAPKYNFPQTSMDTTLPQRFIEQSIQSLTRVRSRNFQLNQEDIQQVNVFESPFQSSIMLKTHPIKLNTRRKETTVAACDTCTMKIGETSTGIIVAVRGASVWKQGKNYRYTRLGPFIFHIPEANKRDVYRALEKSYFNGQTESNHQPFLTLAQMPIRIAGLLERWLQTMLSRTMNDALVLFDGSLMAGIGDTSVMRMKETLLNARRRRNVVLAFSKMTNLRTNGYLITEASLKFRPPCLIETSGLRPKPPAVLLGNVYVARLTQGNCAFRLDIDKENSPEQEVAAVETLLGNDLFSQSYPETLRLAHIFCTFTANEVIAMQHFATRKYGLRIMNRFDMHRLLFGPYGRGENS